LRDGRQTQLGTSIPLDTNSRNGLIFHQWEMDFPMSKDSRCGKRETSGAPIESAGPRVLFGWNYFWYCQAIHFAALKLEYQCQVEESR
jgi:hypothetical protein